MSTQTYTPAGRDARRILDETTDRLVALRQVPAPSVSLVKDYAAPFSRWAENAMQEEEDGMAARDAVARLSTRYSRLVTDWARTGVEPTDPDDVLARYVLAAFLVNDGSV
jgi:hypothetical protein